MIEMVCCKGTFLVEICTFETCATQEVISVVVAKDNGILTTKPMQSLVQKMELSEFGILMNSLRKLSLNLTSENQVFIK